MEEPHHSMGPMTKRRAKSAIPFGGVYRLIDIPLSNIIKCGLTQIYVLTQFNSRSLNSHIVEAYPSASGVPLSKGVFVEVLAFLVASFYVAKYFSSLRFPRLFLTIEI